MVSRCSLLVALVLLSCAPAAPPRTVAPASAPGASAALPVAVAPAEAPPSARVTEVLMDGAGRGRARILFSNPSRSECRVSGYKLVWAAKSKAITVQAFALPSGETRERWIKLDRDDGDLGAVTPEGARVELIVAC